MTRHLICHPDDQHIARHRARQLYPGGDYDLTTSAYVPRGQVYDMTGVDLDTGGYLAPPRPDLATAMHDAYTCARQEPHTPPRTVHVITELGPGDAPALIVAGHRLGSRVGWQHGVGAPFPTTSPAR